MHEPAPVNQPTMEQLRSGESFNDFCVRWNRRFYIGSRILHLSMGLMSIGLVTEGVIRRDTDTVATGASLGTFSLVMNKFIKRISVQNNDGFSKNLQNIRTAILDRERASLQAIEQTYDQLVFGDAASLVNPSLQSSNEVPVYIQEPLFLEQKL